MRGREVRVRFVVMGAGAVGGYVGAKLWQAGEDVTFIARGAHLEGIRPEGLRVPGPLGDCAARAPAVSDPAGLGPAHVVLFTVKGYDTEEALARLGPVVGTETVVLTLQNGVDGIDRIAQVTGPDAVLGGCIYLATSLAGPGVIQQTGHHRRIVFGEVFGQRTTVSDRVSRIAGALQRAGFTVEPVADARVPLWEKFAYLAPMAGFTAAARSRKGTLWAQPGFRAHFRRALAEMERIAAASEARLPDDLASRILTYADDVSPDMRTSMLIDIAQGKRLEVEWLLGSAIRRAAEAGVDAPILETLYHVLKPHEGGVPAGGER